MSARDEHRDEGWPHDPIPKWRGRSLAAEDFGVRLRAEGLPNWQLVLLFSAAGLGVYGAAWVVVELLRPTKPATGGEGLFSLLAIVMTIAIVVASALLTTAAARRARDRELRGRGSWRH